MNAKKDENGRPTVIAVSSANGTTIVQAQAHPTAHSLLMEDGTSGSDHGNNGGNAMIDENSVSVWTAISSTDGSSIVEVYLNPATKKILIKST